MKDIRLAVFEDNIHLRETLALVLNNSTGFTCIGSFPDANNVLKDVERCEPDVILMDIDMPGRNGIEAVKLLKEKFPVVLILMQTVFDQNDKIFDAILAGANGYILKSTTPAELLDCIRDLLNGGAPMSKTVAAKVLHMFRTQPSRETKEMHTLTGRELQVLQELVNGLILKEIAGKLDISFFTVQTHVKNIYDKLHVRSKAEAVAKAMKDRIV